MKNDEYRKTLKSLLNIIYDNDNTAHSNRMVIIRRFIRKYIHNNGHEKYKVFIDMLGFIHDTVSDKTLRNTLIDKYVNIINIYYISDQLSMENNKLLQKLIKTFIESFTNINIKIEDIYDLLVTYNRLNDAQELFNIVVDEARKFYKKIISSFPIPIDITCPKCNTHFQIIKIDEVKV